ncbi:hypothetical protein BH24ACT3_BH24ACT3_03910 [soil metagenome]
MIAIAAVAYFGAMRVAARLADRAPATLALAFLPSLVPIVLAYSVAHHVSLFAVNAQGAAALMSDPSTAWLASSCCREADRSCAGDRGRSPDGDRSSHKHHHRQRSRDQSWPTRSWLKLWWGASAMSSNPAAS